MCTPALLTMTPHRLCPDLCCRLALGSSWEPATEDAAVKADLSWSRLSANVSSLSLGARCGVALTLQREDAPASHPTILEVTQQLQSALRIQGRSAYIALDPTSASAAGASCAAFMPSSPTHLQSCPLSLLSTAC